MQTGRTARDGVELAWAAHAGSCGPTTVFLPGFRSDMTGSKALETQAFCARHGLACLRLDYSGHGASGGTFEAGTIGRWRDDALFLMDELTTGDVVLVGSSMGGWIALLIALARPERVVGLVGIAAAPDFTEALMWAAMTDGEREILLREGILMTPSQYGDPVPISRALIEEGRNHLLMAAPIEVFRAGAAATGAAGSGRAVADRGPAGRAVGGGGRAAHAGQGWRSPAVAARRPRATPALARLAPARG